MSIAHGERTVYAGEPLRSARAAMILLHGRGATAEDILTIASEVQAAGWAYVAPQAAGGAWYPNPFTAPLERNEPFLSAALETVSKLFAQISETVPAERVVVLGFSQGGCLALEWAARHAQRLGMGGGLRRGLDYDVVGDRDQGVGANGCRNRRVECGDGDRAADGGGEAGENPDRLCLHR